MQHKTRKLTVGSRWTGSPEYAHNAHRQPFIRIGGKWLAEYGFRKGSKVKIYAAQNRLILEVDNTPNRIKKHPAQGVL